MQLQGTHGREKFPTILEPTYMYWYLSISTDTFTEPKWHITGSPYGFSLPGSDTRRYSYPTSWLNTVRLPDWLGNEIFCIINSFQIAFLVWGTAKSGFTPSCLILFSTASSTFLFLAYAFICGGVS